MDKCYRIKCIGHKEDMAVGHEGLSPDILEGVVAAPRPAGVSTTSSQAESTWNQHSGR